MVAPKRALNLTEKPETVSWPETHYAFIEKVGPFMETAPAAWGKLHELVPAIAEHNQITGYTSLYKVGPQIYRAGVSLAAAPQNLPAGLHYEKFHGGKYARFVLTGPYSGLPEASGRVFRMISEQQIHFRDDYFIENYLNDPRTTPAEQLVTHILVPVN